MPRVTLVDDPLAWPLALGTGPAAQMLRCRVLLAPLDGITDAILLRRLLSLGGFGSACLPFVRVGGDPIGRAALHRRWRPPIGAPCPVGMQFIAHDPAALAATAAVAAGLGVSFIDFNSGCSAATVVGSGGGAALLDHPARLADLVTALVTATPLPVTVKLRAGGTDDRALEEILEAAARPGVAALTLHARLRSEGWEVPPRWERLARAAAWLRRHRPGLPLVGNGGIHRPADARRMLAETGCDAVMLATGAIADPWLAARLAGRPPPDRGAVLDLVAGYAAAVCRRHPRSSALGRLKQLVARLAVPELPLAEEARRTALLATSPAAVLAVLRAAAG
jgi:tRNA-dihydrouridine synthase C